jgi:hypothetical protein
LQPDEYEELDIKRDNTVNLSVFRRHPACAAVMPAAEAEPKLCREDEFANPTGSIPDFAQRGIEIRL